MVLRRPKHRAPGPPRPKSEVFLDQAAKRRSKRYSAFGVSAIAEKAVADPREGQP